MYKKKPKQIYIIKYENTCDIFGTHPTANKHLPHLLSMPKTGVSIDGGNHAGLRWRDTAAALAADIDVRQDLAAGDDVHLLGNSLQVVQDQSDAVRGVDDGSLRGVELSRRTLNLSWKRRWVKLCTKHSSCWSACWSTHWVKWHKQL